MSSMPKFSHSVWVRTKFKCPSNLTGWALSPRAVLWCQVAQTLQPATTTQRPRRTTALVKAFQMEIAIATETPSTRWACAAARARPTSMGTAFATTVKCTDAPTPPHATTTRTPTWTTVPAKASRRDTATATAPCLTPTTTVCVTKTKSTVATIHLRATTIRTPLRMTALASTALVPILSTPCLWRPWKRTTAT